MQKTQVYIVCEACRDWTEKHVLLQWKINDDDPLINWLADIDQKSEAAVWVTKHHDTSEYGGHNIYHVFTYKTFAQEYHDLDNSHINEPGVWGMLNKTHECEVYGVYIWGEY